MQLYADNCAACHGPEGLGDPTQGFPNLADAIWLHGSGYQAIVNQITHPKNGQMPARPGGLSDDDVKRVAVYVHSLGGGQ